MISGMGTDAAAGSAGDGHASGHHDRRDQQAAATPTYYAQLVHWDRPENDRMGGRRLRIESGRIVWKPNSRNIRDDELVGLFECGKARIVIQDIGATMVKARGIFRTEVPAPVLKVHDTLQGATIDSNTCFSCQRLCRHYCPLCKLWLHPDCAWNMCEAICREHNVDNDRVPEDFGMGVGPGVERQGEFEGSASSLVAVAGPCLVKAFQWAHEPDPDVLHHLSSLLGFDRASDDYPDHGRTEPPPKLLDTSCLVCGSLLKYLISQQPGGVGGEG